jgi:hypothetical protein
MSVSSVWTSASNEGTDCYLERKFSWCLTGKLFAPSDVTNSQLWEKVPDGSPSAARCLGMSVLDRAVLTQDDCANDKKPFACQVYLGIYTIYIKNIVLENPTLKYFSHPAQTEIVKDPV